jgi:sulfide:quinone oxidoreductase
MTSSEISPLHVVVAGGGVAALESTMALADLGQGRLRLTVVSPDDAFHVRAMTVAMPFDAVEPVRVPLDLVMARAGAEHRRATLTGVDAERRIVRCSDGEELGYDALLVATGARQRAAFPEAVTFSDTDPGAVRPILERIERFECAALAVVVPPSGSWPLPAYELALMTAHLAFDAGYDDLPVHLVTPEHIPLELFGQTASTELAEMLRMAGISVHANARVAAVESGATIVIEPGPWRLGVEAVIALPAIDGQPIPGLPANRSGFIPVDEQNRILGVDGVYAAGDVTSYPVKHEGLAALQADAAAADIAARAGAPAAVAPFRPVLRGMLLTGGRPQFLRHVLTAGPAAASTLSPDPLWMPTTKVPGRYLSPLLVDVVAQEHSVQGIAVDVELSEPEPAR